MARLIGPAPAVNGVIIQHVITADDPFGEPWPPDGSCSIVRRARGFTLWRRIFLSAFPIERAALPGALSSLIIWQHNSQPRNHSDE
jgi:hypothetical protein